jgi:hypothetical protein
MVKNSRFEARVSEETLRRFDIKAEQLNLSRTELLEKISNEPIIFIENVRQKFINKNGVQDK